jgi:integrase
MASYLQKRRRLWYAVLEIPAPLRPQLGKPRFLQSLGTDSRSIAERRAGPIVAQWKRSIAEARGEPVDDAAWFRRRLHRAKDEKEREAILEQISVAADDIAYDHIDPGQPLSSVPEAQAFYASATSVNFTEHLDEWFTTSRATAKTKDMQRSDIKRFAAIFATVEAVTRPEVRRWITSLMNEDGLAPKTVQRVLSALRGYWRYLQSIKAAGEDNEPFAKLDVARQNKRTEPRSKRQPFEPADVVRLLGEAIGRGDSQLAELIRLGMWTGCRIEKLGALTVGRVKGDYFSVEDAKTAAGWRDVPIHHKLAKTMARLIDCSTDGYVLSGLSVTKYGDRSNALGKRFGRLKNDLGFGPAMVFHSVRKTVVTILENAGVAENVVADIVGHEKQTMTYGLYSGGASLKVKAKALARLAYPGYPAVDGDAA